MEESVKPATEMLDVKRSTTEKLFAYIDADRDIRIEATRTGVAGFVDAKTDWQFSIHDNTTTVYMKEDAADRARQFIREVLQDKPEAD